MFCTWQSFGTHCALNTNVGSINDLVAVKNSKVKTLKKQNQYDNDDDGDGDDKDDDDDDDD